MPGTTKPWDTNSPLRDRHTEPARWDEMLLALGAAQAYEEIGQVIADSARLLSDAALVTLTVPAADGHGTIVLASGGLTDAAYALPILTVPLGSVPDRRDEPAPLLHIHGGVAEDPALITQLTRFAPHALLALARGRAYAEIMELAYSDPLTGLANSRALQAALNRTAATANAEGQPLALLIIDLDDFRRYNTNWGHLVGDAALQAFARALRSATRGTDFVARIGGEEFAVLLVASGELEARVVAAHIHEAIASGGSDLPSPFTASIGIGLFPNDVPDAMSLFAVADTAVLMAKRQGKNRTYIFESVQHTLDP